MTQIDAELVARSRANDTGAFGTLVERHQRLVFGVALARCGDPALAEDVAQEAFMTAWRDLDRLRDVDRVGPWMAGIARNLAASAARVRSRHADVIDVPGPPVPTPCDEALEREDRELLVRALAEVPESHRESLVLYYIEGESIADIAEVLGIREELVKQRLSRGRKALRESVASRVERALIRASTKATLRVTVVGALSTASMRRAKAASTATGKVVLTMAAKHIVAAALVAAGLAGTAIWFARRSGTSERDATAKPSADRSTPQGSSVDRSKSKPTSRVHRLADPASRTALLDAIHQRAAAKQQANAGTPSHGGGAAPELPGEDLDRVYIRESVQGILPMLADCYNEGLTRDPKLQGTIVVDFTIEGQPDVGGVVSESSIVSKDSDLADPTVRECIQQTMFALEIDPPKDGGVVHVRYPFAFAPE